MTRKDNYLDFEEAYFSNDRKLSRKERKEASNKDRSQFKKSDQDQLKRQVVQEESTTDHEHLLRGKILSIAADGILVDCEGSEFICSLKGILKKEKKRIKNLVAVGDIVLFEQKGPLEGSISKVERRTSILSRADNLSRNKEQLIAVNVDQVLITCSVLSPPLKPPLIDRYIIAAKKGNIEPIIVINKIDLFDSPPPEINSLACEIEQALFDELVATYRSLNLTVIPVSASTGKGMDKLREVMYGKTSVFSGQSGVGKSRLITLITGLQIAMGTIVRKTQKGSHTTTTTNLIRFEKGSYCIDTPGIKSFGVWDLKKEDIHNYFPEIQLASTHCKFPDCSHMSEPVCGVQEAVESGAISLLRFESYCALMIGLEQKHFNR